MSNLFCYLYFFYGCKGSITTLIMLIILLDSYTQNFRSIIYFNISKSF